MSGYGNPPTTPPPAEPRRPANVELPQLIGYAAGVLGILSFVWGFLTWFSEAAGLNRLSAAGYSLLGSGAGAAIGLSIAAGAIAAAGAFEKKPAGVVPAALSFAAFLVSLGLLIGRSPAGTTVGVGIGLILELITTFLQTVGLAYAWLLATGRTSLPQQRRAADGWPAQHRAQPQDPYRASPGMAGPGAPPPGQFPPQPPPGGYAPAAQPQYGPPPSYTHRYPSPPSEPPTRGYGPPPATSPPGAPPSPPATEPGSGPSAPPPQPEEHPGAPWSPQTPYPGSHREPEPPASEEGSANP